GNQHISFAFRCVLITEHSGKEVSATLSEITGLVLSISQVSEQFLLRSQPFREDLIFFALRVTLTLQILNRCFKVFKFFLLHEIAVLFDPPLSTCLHSETGYGAHFDCLNPLSWIQS